MKTIFVNIKTQRVTTNNQTCNFEEAGLCPNGNPITDRDQIAEHLEDREGENDAVEIIFDDEFFNFTLKYKGASLSVIYVLRDGDDHGTASFQNPTTGSYNENIETVLWGWQEQNPEASQEWKTLVELAKLFCDSELYWKITNGGVYELEPSTNTCINCGSQVTSPDSNLCDNCGEAATEEWHQTNETII